MLSGVIMLVQKESSEVNTMTIREVYKRSMTMKLRDFIEMFSNNTKFTITESVFYRDTDEYYSFRTVYYAVPKSDLEDEIGEVDVFDDFVSFVDVYMGIVRVDVKTFIDRKEN